LPNHFAHPEVRTRLKAFAALTKLAVTRGGKTEGETRACAEARRRSLSHRESAASKIQNERNTLSGSFEPGRLRYVFALAADQFGHPASRTQSGIS